MNYINRFRDWLFGSPETAPTAPLVNRSAPETISPAPEIPKKANTGIPDIYRQMNRDMEKRLRTSPSNLRFQASSHSQDILDDITAGRRRQLNLMVDLIRELGCFGGRSVGTFYLQCWDPDHYPGEELTTWKLMWHNKAVFELTSPRLIWTEHGHIPADTWYVVFHDKRFDLWAEEFCTEYDRLWETHLRKLYLELA